MTAVQEPLFGCPFGGCGPYGWCPCAEPDDLEPEPDEDELYAYEPGTELMHVRGRLRAVETLPPLDHYQHDDSKAQPCI